ncbi:MAG: hypothetical protein CSA84_05725 [Actinomycetales bacterium]|nr:MAG: hypothetical protein CSA84_05725 [Actinomycetales bacterium]
MGSVAEEAARLIGLFSRGLTEEQIRQAGARASGAGRDHSKKGRGRADDTACPTCGHDPAVPQADSTCRSCPVCRIVGTVRRVNPDALDRLADVVDLVSDGIRAYAANRRRAAAREARARAARQERERRRAASDVRDVTAEFFGPHETGPDDPYGDDPYGSVDADDIDDIGDFDDTGDFDDFDDAGETESDVDDDASVDDVDEDVVDPSDSPTSRPGLC